METAPQSGTAALSVEATVGGCHLQISCTVPAGPTRLDDMLPLLMAISDRVVSTAEDATARRGVPISCKKGCGACCRQLVPISPLEARHIARLVSELPEPRRSEIEARFAAAKDKLQQAGLWQRLEERQSWPETQVSEIGLEYFRQRIPCPFLEDESCSIHPERPLACREYLVTSPAENCANPAPQLIEWLPLPAKVWVSAARCEPAAENEKYLNWVPLIQSLDYAATHEEPSPTKTGPELVREVLENMSVSTLEAPAPPPP
jgi:Fe-S-cluster containining protein